MEVDAKGEVRRRTELQLRLGSTGYDRRVEKESGLQIPERPSSLLGEKWPPLSRSSLRASDHEAAALLTPMIRVR
jgi:hypothetical protein